MADILTNRKTIQPYFKKFHILGLSL